MNTQPVRNSLTLSTNGVEYSARQVEYYPSGVSFSFDVDPAAIENNYLECLKSGETNIFPLLLDLTNPSSGLGWENQERMSLLEWGPVDMVLALALVHYLAISNNLPFEKIVGFFSKSCNSLIIELVPRQDSQVQRLLSTREDIFADYIQEALRPNSINIPGS